MGFHSKAIPVTSGLRHGEVKRLPLVKQDVCGVATNRVQSTGPVS